MAKKESCKSLIINCKFKIKIQKSKSKILLRTPNWLGDMVLVLPAVNALRKALPEAVISVLVKKSMADFWRMTCVDQIIPFDFSKGFSGIIDRWKMAENLKKERFDTALIFPNSFDSAFVPWLAGIPERVGWPTDGRGLFLTNKISKPVHLRSEQQFLTYIYLIETWLGKKLEYSTDLSLNVPEEDMLFVENRLGEFNRPVLGLNPGATYGSAKCWIPERFAETALKAHAEKNASIIIIGGPGDTQVCSEVFNLIKKQNDNPEDWCINIAGKTSICELAAWLKQCKCLLTNDTGGMHVAAAAGTPVVAVFGPTDWTSTAPLGSKHRLIKTDAECAPCLKRECPSDHKCMLSIKTETVWEEINCLLQ